MKINKAVVLSAVLGIVSSAGAQSFLTNGLVAYYPLHGDARDAVGSNHGTVLRGAPAEDRFGTPNRAIYFNGLDTLVECTDTGLPSGNAPRTVSAWIKIESFGVGGPTIGYITSYGVDGANNAFYGTVDGANAGGPYFTVGRAGGGDNPRWGRPQLGTWYHVLVSHDGAVTSIYVNGGNRVTSSRSYATTLSGKFLIGSYIGGYPPTLHGAMSDVRIYDRALSATEVASLFESEATPPDNTFMSNGLVAYYPFNGNANDESGLGDHGYSIHATLSSDRFGLPSRAYYFDGSTQAGITTHGSFLPTNSAARTVSLWIKPDDLTLETASTWISGGLFQYGAIAAADSTFQGQFVWQSSPKVVSLYLGTEISWGWDAWLAGWDYSHWHHVLWSYSGDRYASVFVDGRREEFETDPPVGVVFRTSQGPLSIGAAGGRYFRGHIDDVRIYNRALSDQEVRHLYNSESVPHTHPATATAQVINGFVIGATITDGGYGYTNAPAVRFVGGGGSGAAATSTISNGVVTAITIVNAGFGYTSVPTIVIDDPPYPPTQATATATINNGFVTGASITDGGHGYGTTPPPIHLFGGGGTGAKATVTVENGVVTGITITAAGSGYTNAPTVLIAVPPGSPKLGIEVSQVRVVLDLLLGYSYKVQTTTDAGITWTDAGTPFLATEAKYTQTFPVAGLSQLFRVVQVP